MGVGLGRRRRLAHVRPERSDATAVPQSARGGRGTAQLALRVAPQIEAVGSVDEAVQDGVGHRGVADQIVPFGMASVPFNWRTRITRIAVDSPEATWTCDTPDDALPLMQQVAHGPIAQVAATCRRGLDRIGSAGRPRNCLACRVAPHRARAVGVNHQHTRRGLSTPMRSSAEAYGRILALLHRTTGR